MGPVSRPLRVLNPSRPEWSAWSIAGVCATVAELSRGVVYTFSKLGADLGFGAPIRPLDFEHFISVGMLWGSGKPTFRSTVLRTPAF